jgi:hypothetical protein
LKLRLFEFARPGQLQAIVHKDTSKAVPEKPMKNSSKEPMFF